MVFMGRSRVGQGHCARRRVRPRRSAAGWGTRWDNGRSRPPYLTNPQFAGDLGQPARPNAGLRGAALPTTSRSRAAPSDPARCLRIARCQMSETAAARSLAARPRAPGRSPASVTFSSATRRSSTVLTATGLAPTRCAMSFTVNGSPMAKTASSSTALFTTGRRRRGAVPALAARRPLPRRPRPASTSTSSGTPSSQKAPTGTPSSPAHLTTSSSSAGALSPARHGGSAAPRKPASRPVTGVWATRSNGYTCRHAAGGRQLLGLSDERSLGAPPWHPTDLSARCHQPSSNPK